MKSMLFAATALAAAVASAQMPPEYLKRVADGYRASLKASDRDGDGVVTREEVRGDLTLEARFDDIDINRDGRITPDEAERFLADIPLHAR
jgi:hypothetical protein